MKSASHISLDEFSSIATKKYRIELTEKKLPDLELNPSGRLTLSLCKESNYSPTMLETSDIDELKHWIGTPDELFDARCCEQPVKDWLPAGVVGKSREAGAALKRTIEKLKPADHQRIMHLMKAYIYGDSRELSIYKPLLEVYWDKFRIPVWWFRRIYVPAGSVVTLSPGSAGILWAYSIEIEEGGKVLCQGTMTFDVSQVKKI